MSTPVSELLNALAGLIKALTPFVPLFVSFALGWGLFEITERRKTAMRRHATRLALVAELERVEVILSTTVYLSAFGADDPTEGIREFRWSVANSRARRAFVEEPSQELMALATRSDGELVQAFRAFQPWRQPAFTVPLPILDSVLADPDSGLSLEQWQRLGHVKWESYLLEVLATDVREWTRLTFTVTDPDNHGIVEENRLGARAAYAKRANHMLITVRAALGGITNRR